MLLEDAEDHRQSQSRALARFLGRKKGLEDARQDVRGDSLPGVLNLETHEFAHTVPTTENIAIAAWKRLERAIASTGGAKLSRIRVYETPEIFAEYRGPNEQLSVRGEKFRGEA